MLKRQFLRALVRNLWGVALDGRTHEDVAHWLTVRGYSTTVSDVKNATRRNPAPVDGAVATVDSSLALLR